MIYNHHGDRWSEKPVETELNGKVVWAKFVAFGDPATTVRRNYYSSHKAAINGDISDSFENCKAFEGSDNIYN